MSEEQPIENTTPRRAVISLSHLKRDIKDDDPLNRSLDDGRGRRNRGQTNKRRSMDSADVKITVNTDNSGRHSGKRSRNDRNERSTPSMNRPLSEDGKRQKREEFEEDEKKDQDIAQQLEKFVVENKQLNVPAEEVSRLISEYGNKPLASGLAHLIVTQNLEFPYKKYFVGDHVEKFKNLCDFKMEFVYDVEYTIPQFVELSTHMRPFVYDGRSTQIPAKTSDYLDMNVLSDIFQEPARIESQAGYSAPTAADHWGANLYSDVGSRIFSSKNVS